MGALEDIRAAVANARAKVPEGSSAIFDDMDRLLDHVERLRRAVAVRDQRISELNGREAIQVQNLVRERELRMANGARAKQLAAEVVDLQVAIHGCSCLAPYDECPHDEPFVKVVERLQRGLAAAEEDANYWRGAHERLSKLVAEKGLRP